MNAYQNQLLDAIDTVSAWDLDDDNSFADAVNAQARLMCGVLSDDHWCFDSETPIH